MWRYKTKRRRAVAEEDIQIALQRRGYGDYLKTNVRIEFTPEEVKEYDVKGTEADGIYSYPFMVIYFVDGQLHLKYKQELRDEQIDKVLRKRGYTVLRLPYVAPLREWRKIEIVTEIIKTLNKKGYGARGRI